MANHIQNAFSAGEMSPSLYGRTDLSKYTQGASTVRNFFINYRGGASSRAGLAYVGTCKQPGTAAPPRDIPFQFNINQGYALEFGDQYMRIKSSGAYVVETSVAVSSVSVAGLFTTGTAHGYSVGDWVYNLGNTGFSGLTWIVNSTPTGSTFTVTDLFGAVISSATASTTGTVARIYTVVAPYAAVDLPYLKYTQNKDTMSLTCVNQQTFTEYPTYELTRSGNTSWAFTQANFTAAITAPTNVAGTATASTTLSTYYSYVVTAVSASGEESIASSPVYLKNNDIAINAGSNNITWKSVVGAVSYNVYKATPSYNIQVPVGSLYGFAGRSIGASFTDNNITADFTQVPPVHTNPFARGAVTGINITSNGTGYTQDGINYRVTTSTGSGFVGIPIVSGGSFTGMVIQNGGMGYAPADTITITGGPGYAIGTYTFTTNPAAGTNIVLNGVTWTFVAANPTGNQTTIQASAQATVRQLALDLNASVSASLTPASYTASDLVLNITYDTSGAGGNAYTLVAGTYGGVVSGATLAGGGATTNGATATLVLGAATGTYPSVVAYFQQRRVYANTVSQPDTYFFSKPGAFLNFDSSTPVNSGDAFTGSPWAQQVNGIQFLIPMPNGLVVLTGKGAWLLTGSGGQNTALSASSQDATAQAYNGCNAIVPPVIINYDILFVQAKGSIVRDLSYSFFTNIFTGTDTTVLSNHLFNFHQILQWAYSEEPYKLVWCIRDDGNMLSLTYLKEQDVYAWARHDTNGLFVGICSITEPPVDATYVITKRYIRGPQKWVYYSERMDNRNWQNVEDSFCVDSGLSYTKTYPNATLTPTAANGTSNISSVNLIAGGSGYVSPIITAYDPSGAGSGATFSATIVSGVITAITPLTQGINYIQGSQLTISDSVGTGAVAHPIITNNVTFNASSSVFNVGMVGNVLRIGNNNAPVSSNGTITASGSGRAIITSYVSGTQIIANITQAITNVMPDDPYDTPIPVSPNQWSLAVPTLTVSGLNHLEGMTVAILADGSVVADKTVVNGAITLPNSASSISIGLPYICQLQSLYLDVPGGQQTIQGKRKTIPAVTVRVESSRGLQVGTNQPDQATQPNNAIVDWSNMKPFKERNAQIHAGVAIPLFTGDERVNIPSDWKKPGQVAVQQIYPLKADVLAFIPEFVVGDL